MSIEELRSYRLSSLEEPSYEMLLAIMAGVAEEAKQSSLSAKANIEARFRQLDEQVKESRAHNSAKQ